MTDAGSPSESSSRRREPSVPTWSSSNVRYWALANCEIIHTREGAGWFSSPASWVKNLGDADGIRRSSLRQYCVLDARSVLFHPPLRCSMARAAVRHLSLQRGVERIINMGSSTIFIDSLETENANSAWSIRWPFRSNKRSDEGIPTHLRCSERDEFGNFRGSNCAKVLDFTEKVRSWPID